MLESVPMLRALLRGFLVFVGNVLGLFFILSACAAAYVSMDIALEEGALNAILYSIIIVGFQAFLGMFLLIEVIDKGHETVNGITKSALSNFLVMLGSSSIFFAFLVVLYSISTVTGTVAQVVMVLLLLFVCWAIYYARVHRDWKSKGINTPKGKITVGDALGFIFFCVFQLIFELIIALITGGVGGGGGGGGSFSGGGASGSW